MTNTLNEILNQVRALHPADQLRVVTACRSKLFIPESWSRITLEEIIDRPVSELEWSDFLTYIDSGRHSHSFSGPYIEDCWTAYLDDRGGRKEMVNEMFTEAADENRSKTEPPSFGEVDEGPPSAD